MNENNITIILLCDGGMEFKYKIKSKHIAFVKLLDETHTRFTIDLNV